MLSVDVSLSKVDNLGPKAVNGVRDYLEAGADRGFARYIEELPVDRDTLQANSFSPVWDSDSRLVYGTRDTPYARAQDEGTGPYTPPIEPLLEWGERVLGSRAAGAGAWQSIREDGIEPKGFSDAAREAQRKWYASNEVQSFVDRRVE